MSKLACLVAGAAVFGAMTALAAAADLPSPAPPPEPVVAPASSDILITLGLGTNVGHTFPGTKTYSFFPLPYVDWRKPGEPEPFHAADDGFGISIIDSGQFKAGPVGRYITERGVGSGNANFVGLPTVGWSVEIGGFAEYWPTDFLRGRVEVRQAVDGHRGLDANIEADVVQRYGAWLVSIGPRAAFGDDRFMSAYFSVTPAQAAANGNLTPYTATGGLTSLGFLGQAKYALTPSWSLTGFAGYNRLTGSAAASPIPNNLGSKDEFVGGGILEYTFAFKGFGFGF